MSQGKKIHLECARNVGMLFAEIILPDCHEVIICGSVRRNRAVVGDLDIVAVVKDIDAFEGVLDLLFGPLKTKPGRASRNGMWHRVPINVFDVVPEARGAAMLMATGSAAFNIWCRIQAKKKGWKLNRYGLWDGMKRVCDCSEEEPILKSIGCMLIPPPLRGKEFYGPLIGDQYG